MFVEQVVWEDARVGIGLNVVVGLGREQHRLNPELARRVLVLYVDVDTGRKLRHLGGFAERFLNERQDVQLRREALLGTGKLNVERETVHGARRHQGPRRRIQAHFRGIHRQAVDAEN